MDINITLFGELLTFLVLFWIVARYIWPRLTKAIEDRQQQILADLAAAQQGKNELSRVTQEIEKSLAQSSQQAQIIIGQAQLESKILLEDAKVAVQEEHSKMLRQVEDELRLKEQTLRRALQRQTAELATMAASKIIAQAFDDDSHSKLVERIIFDIRS